MSQYTEIVKVAFEIFLAMLTGTLGHSPHITASILEMIMKHNKSKIDICKTIPCKQHHGDQL